jgi:SAM-dependent methyltransferase
MAETASPLSSSTSTKPTYVLEADKNLSKNFNNRTAESCAPYLIPYIKPTHRILDLGCGPGTISADFALLVPQGEVVCMDVYDSTVDQARETFSNRNLSNGSFVVADATRPLPFEDGAFDVVHTHMVLSHLPNPLAIMKEIRRVLKPETGIAASREALIDSMQWYPLSSGLKKLGPAMVAATVPFGADGNLGRRLKGLALEAGYKKEDIISTASIRCYESEVEVARWADQLESWFESDLFGKKMVKDGSLSEEDRLEVVASLKEWRKSPAAWHGLMNGDILAFKR